MTIHQLKAPCSVLDWGPHPDDVGLAHYDTHAEAEAALAGEHDEDDSDGHLAPARIRELPYLCWVAECDAPEGPEGTCGDTLGDEDEGLTCIHFETLDELFEWMPGESWTRSGADGALCWDHSPDAAPPAAADAAPPEIAGQLVLPGVLP